MNLIERLGVPDVTIGPLQIWVHGREFEHEHDYWDGNWLRVTAHCATAESKATVQGPIIHLTELSAFTKQLKELDSSEREQAQLLCIEPNLKVTLIKKADTLGHIDLKIQMTADNLTEEHRFHVHIDSSYLPSMIEGCNAILKKFPIRG